MSKSSAAEKNENLVDGVDVTKVKLSLVVKALDEAEIDSKEMTATEKVAALQKYNRKNVEKANLVACTNCGGFGDAEGSDACQFCGDEGEEDEGDEKEETTMSEAEPKTGKVVSLAKAKGKKETVTNLSKYTEKDLDEANVRIMTLKQSGAETYWKLGNEIAVVYDNELWKLRLSGKKQAYTNFNKYAENELKISRQHAMNMMDTAKKFSEAQIEKHGSTKLSLVLTAPQKDQPAILKEIEGGASAKQVREKVKESRKKAKLNKRDTGRKPNKGGSKGRKASGGRMTVAMVEGKQTLHMFAKPEKKLAEGEKLEKHAMKVNDVPFAMEEMSNGVVRYYTVTLGPKGLKLEIETKRAD